jgi:hypothetical protein
LDLLESVTKAVDDYQGVLYPHSPLTLKFDNFVAVLLLFTSTVTPFEIAYLKMDINALFFINRFVDLGFCMDVSNKLPRTRRYSLFAVCQCVQFSYFSASLSTMHADLAAIQGCPIR